MIISLRCHNCKDTLTGDSGGHLFLCKGCKISYLLRDDSLLPINTFEIENDREYTHLLPVYLYDITIDYTLFSNRRQEEVAQSIGTDLKMVVRGFSMIDPIYFGDLELTTAEKINSNELQLRPIAPEEKNLNLNIKPEVAERLLKYNFMRYFDRRADITGLHYNYTINETRILFLKTILKDKTIHFLDLNKDLPYFAILSISPEISR